MKTFVIAFALLACCTAFVPGEFRNLTDTEIEYDSHVQSLIPSSLQEVLKINDLDNKFNTTDFILDKINFVSQKEFSNGYIYKINVDFLNSADEIAQTEFIGTYNGKMKKLSIPSLSYDIKYPKFVEEEEEVFIPSPINGTNSFGVYKHLRNYLNENFNSTYGLSGNTTMYNNTYIPLDYNKTEDYNWRNNTFMTYNNTYYNSTNKTDDYNWRNNTSMTYNNRTNNISEISSANITEFVYNALNNLVDQFNNTMNLDSYYSVNKTSNNVTEIDLTELEPIIDDFFKFVNKEVQETFGFGLKEMMTTLLDLAENSEIFHDAADTLHDVADELDNIFA